MYVKFAEAGFKMPYLRDVSQPTTWKKGNVTKFDIDRYENGQVLELPEFTHLFTKVVSSTEGSQPNEPYYKVFVFPIAEEAFNMVWTSTEFAPHKESLLNHVQLSEEDFLKERLMTRIGSLVWMSFIQDISESPSNWYSNSEFFTFDAAMQYIQGLITGGAIEPCKQEELDYYH